MIAISASGLKNKAGGHVLTMCSNDEYTETVIAHLANPVQARQSESSHRCFDRLAPFLRIIRTDRQHSPNRPPSGDSVGIDTMSELR